MMNFHLLPKEVIIFQLQKFQIHLFETQIASFSIQFDISPKPTVHRPTSTL